MQYDEKRLMLLPIQQTICHFEDLSCMRIHVKPLYVHSKEPDKIFFMNAKGKVILAGAGPGDPELISIKAARYLQKADVVLADRLVSEDILDEYVSKAALLIPVGKQCSRKISTPQEEINKLMIQYAKRGKLVVRLKGGDVSFFSNVLDELSILKKNNIPYEIVPGITAASGVAAYAGFPLTARNFSTGVRFLTAYESSIVADEYWKDLASTSDTLVFYMSSLTLDELVDKLIFYGAPAEQSIAVIEQGTTPLQQVYTTTIKEYDATLKGMKFLSPSLVVIGKVVELQKDFNWFHTQPNTNRQHYFQPLNAPLKELIYSPEKELYAKGA
ncbi:MAG: uroporphyrin-III C-methyltransferase [Chitinophagaceae bacterium]|nr:uroporphyrin-III C-methyltransferase [Chitinophagaceae bacterium]